MQFQSMDDQRTQQVRVRKTFQTKARKTPLLRIRRKCRQLFYTLRYNSPVTILFCDTSLFIGKLVLFAMFMLTAWSFALPLI